MNTDDIYGFYHRSSSDDEIETDSSYEITQISKNKKVGPYKSV